MQETVKQAAASLYREYLNNPDSVKPTDVTVGFDAVNKIIHVYHHVRGMPVVLKTYHGFPVYYRYVGRVKPA